MKLKTNQLLLTVLLGIGFPLGTLQAQNSFFAPGDLILYVQKVGDPSTIYVGLGNAASMYRGASAGPTADRQALNIVDINSALTSAYGAGWASDTSIFVGLAGCLSNQQDFEIVNGDTNRTVYISRARTALGTVGAANSTAWDLNSAQTQNAASTNIANALANNFETLATTRVATLSTSVSLIDNQNPVNSGTFIQGQAFSAFTGGVQQRGTASSIGTFGAADSVEFALDLNRIVPRADSETVGEVSGVKLIGSYEGTIVIGTNGKVSFMTQGTGTPYENWILSFGDFSFSSSKRLATADPDFDGNTNLMEFVLNGNPTMSDPGIAPVLDASGSNFVFTFNRRDDSEAGSTLVFQHGSDLAGWTNVPIGAVSNLPTVQVIQNANTDAITVTIPKSVAPGGKLFGRLKVTQP